MKADKGKVVSVIDIGSNTIKYLVAAKGMELLDYGSEDTRIGVGMGREGPVILQQAAIEAGVECVKKLWDKASAFKPDEREIVATSAVRDAQNREEFVSLVKEATGAQIRILSGAEEAQYVGAGVSRDPNITAYKPFYLMDLGGGSLELLEYNGGVVRQKVSLPLGAVRLKEKLIRDAAAPMSMNNINEVREYVTETVIASGFDFRNPAALIGTGGGLTHARFMLAAQKGLSKQESDATLPIAKMRALMYSICGMKLEDRAKLPKLPVARADIMPVAMIVLTTIMDLAMVGSVVHSFYNLRYGIAAELLGESR